MIVTTNVGKPNSMLKNLKSWKTTLVGWLAGLALLIPQLIAILDGDEATEFNMDAVWAGLAAFGIGTLAKDGDKSTEDLA